jgi:hypothetical protein
MPRVIRVKPLFARDAGPGAVAVNALLALRPEHEVME